MKSPHGPGALAGDRLSGRQQTALARTAAALCLAAAGGAQAQDADPARATAFTPRLSITQTLTDSYSGAAGGDGAEAITTISPGLRLSTRSGPWQGSVDYALTGVLYARNSAANSLHHRLSASAQAEPVQGHLTVTATAQISQQPISLLGLQVADPVLDDSNHSDVKTLSVAPTLRGTLGGLFAVQAGLQATVTDSGTRSASDSTNTTASLALGPAAAGARLGWSIDASRSVSDFDRGRRTESDRLVAGLSVQVLPDLRVSARGGVESNDFTTIDKQRYDTWGAGLVWTPTDRTRVQVDGDRRSFGHSHAVAVEHRMRRSALRYTDSQSVADGAARTAGALVSARGLFLELFKSQEPDLTLREQLVNDFLLRNGIPPDALIGGGFLASSAAVHRRQELSLATQGLRTSVIVSAFATHSRRADTLVAVADDLSSGGVRQRGLSFTVTHRLTPTGSVGLSGTTQRSQSDGLGQRNTLNTLMATWTEQVSRRMRASLSVRHSAFGGDADERRENALTGTLNVSF